VANGFESIAGQINVELKKPAASEKLYANMYVNDAGKTDINLNLSAKLNKQWSMGVMLHDDFLANKKVDENEDGFRDLPTGNQFSAVNRWHFDNGRGWMAQFGIKLLNDRKTGGETVFNASSDKNTTQHYGVGINTARYEVFGKMGYVFPQKKYKSIGLQLSAINHRQNAYFGTRSYDGVQQNLYGNLIYQSIINNANHKFRTGISFVYDKYHEEFSYSHYRRTEITPGAFAEYTWTWTSKFTMVAGARADHNSLFGLFFTPRIHLRYEPVKGTTFRISAGRGQRTANIFAENTSAWVNARKLEIIGGTVGKAYGLNPEIAWNKGISIDQQFRLFAREASAGIDFFRNDFTSQVVVDLENPRAVKLYNLQGLSYSNSLQVAFSCEPLERLELRLAYRYYDVKTSYSGQLLQRPLIAANRAFANLGYAWKSLKFDYTFNLNGRKRIPGTSDNPAAYRLEEYSPAFSIMNTELTKTIGKKHSLDVYIGAENFLDFRQERPILSADQPFSNYFDASLIWGPINGRMLFIGWRYKIK
jgi:outer membrane receptor for ferrienterochelin and colicins